MNTSQNNKTIIYHPELSNISETAKIGDNCKIHSHVWIGDNVKIGDNCKIQSFVFIPEGVIIEDEVFVGPHVCFTNDKNPPSGKAKWQTTIIKKGTKIGAGAVILPGIIIEENAMIGAGAVVTKNVLSNITVVGNPAKPL